MKILKKGCLPKDKVYTVTCQNCKTRFQFKEGEGKVVDDERDGDYIEVKCPLCKERVIDDLK